MDTLLLVSNIVLWVVLLFVGFLLLGALRAMGLLSWRLEQLEATTPSRIGRSGLKPGKKAPDFTLPSVADGELSLHDFAGRKVLLVFVQCGCAPCHLIAPELNRLARDGEVEVLVVNNADPDEAREWAADVGARFPVLVQERWSLSKRFESFATPFAFLIDEQGVISSRGIVLNRQHIRFVFDAAHDAAGSKFVETESDRAEQRQMSTLPSISSKEVSHD